MQLSRESETTAEIQPSDDQAVSSLQLPGEAWTAAGILGAGLLSLFTYWLRGRQDGTRPKREIALKAREHDDLMGQQRREFEQRIQDAKVDKAEEDRRQLLGFKGRYRSKAKETLDAAARHYRALREFNFSNHIDKTALHGCVQGAYRDVSICANHMLEQVDGLRMHGCEPRSLGAVLEAVRFEFDERDPTAHIDDGVPEKLEAAKRQVEDDTFPAISDQA